MQRRGVSMMEVVFAVGAISIGLLGVISLFPLALHQVGEGVKVDLARQAGVNALERFSAHGMNRPDQWVMYDSTYYNFPPRIFPRVPVATNSAVDVVGADTPVMLMPDGPNTAFLIDPGFVATRGSSNAGGFDARLFPYYSRAGFYGSPPVYWEDPRMRRISLAPNHDETEQTLPAQPAILRVPHAASIFTGLDELVFKIPKEANLSPVQEFGSAGPGTTVPASPISPTAGAPSGSKRQYDGRISWMATLTPQLELTDPFAEPSDLYLLSIVILHNRDNSFAINTTNERLVDVATFYNSGLGGGDVNLTVTSLDPAGHLELQRGNWILLMSNVHLYEPAGPGTPLRPGVPLFGWYRVVETEEEPRVITAPSPPTPGVAERYVTLQGADWPVDYLASSITISTAAGSIAKPPRPTRAVIMPDVLAVYETTVRLQTSGAWVD
jgi:hypothetical protein